MFRRSLCAQSKELSSRSERDWATQEDRPAGSTASVAVNKDEIFSLACSKLRSIRLPPQSAENEAAIKEIATEATERSIPAEDAFWLVIDTTPALIHTGRPDGYLDYFNQRWLEFLGLPLEEVCGWRWTGAIHPEDVAGLLQKWHAALGSGEPLEAESRVRRANGEYRLLLHRKVPLRNERGDILRWYGSSVDIEEQRRTQERILQDERERFSEALLAEAQRITRIGTLAQRLTRVGSFLFRLPDATEYWSPESFQIFGADPAKGPPRNMSEYSAFVHPDDRERFLREAAEIFAKGQAYEHNHRIVRPDGEIRLVRVVGCPLQDKGVVTRFIGAFADITEREQLTRDLRQSEFYLNEGQRLAHAGSWAFDSAGFDYWSPELFRIHGLDPAGKAPTVQEYLDLVHPEDRESMANLIKRLVTQALPFDTTKRIVRPDGEVRYVRCVGASVVENQGPTKFVGTAVDVTDHEFLTQELRRRETYRAQAEALSHTGSFGWNPSSGQLFWSDETFSVLGYDQGVTPSLDLVFRRVHPDDVALLREMLSAASKNERSIDFEHRLLLPNGSIKYVHVLARPFKRESGSIEFVGSVMDVTATKKAFEEIKGLKDELYKENIVLREEVDKISMFEEVVGTSPALQTVLARASKAAPTDSTVLILGETGTGKELIARAIHKRSLRSTRAFVSVNCAAIPPSLVTSELFGHEKGAFTGAIQRRLGRFELADGGTLFLDEIGELPMETQIALLRVLQEREFERVGGTERIRADVRVIAATNRDLQGAITAGTFRSDLFYRLNVFPIVLPPLRERKEDVPALISYFVDRYAKRAGRKIRSIRKSALNSLQSYSWPGNIRELQNVIERSLIVCETDEFTIDKSWLSGEPMPTRSTDQASIETSAPGERESIEAALAQTKGKVSGSSGAAAKLGLPASTLESKIRSLKINKYRFKEH
jgi:PAS domain S-box-containing protein